MSLLAGESGRRLSMMSSNFLQGMVEILFFCVFSPPLMAFPSSAEEGSQAKVRICSAFFTRSKHAAKCARDFACDF